MSWRNLTVDPFTRTMSHGTMTVSMNQSVSKIVSPMRNTDIQRAEKNGDWSELLQKAQANTRRFRRDFYR